jgi:hypothetical protein
MAFFLICYRFVAIANDTNSEVFCYVNVGSSLISKCFSFDAVKMIEIFDA